MKSKKILFSLLLGMITSQLFCSAFEHLQALTDFGPRSPNSQGIKFARRYIIQKLSTLPECQIEKDSFVAFLSNKPQAGVNIIAHLHPNIAKRILLCTHYDTRYVADNDEKNPTAPVPGANDGASGVAALLHLAKIFAKHPNQIGIDFAFFDLEDQGDNNSAQNWIIGSKNYAKKIVKKDYELVILLDMIAGKEQKFCQEKFAQLSFPQLNKNFWQIAGFKSEEGKYIYDDHIPFINIGIPTIAIIGLPYPYHHTSQDIVRNCSPKTLNKVIDATYRYILLYYSN